MSPYQTLKLRIEYAFNINILMMLVRIPLFSYYVLFKLYFKSTFAVDESLKNSPAMDRIHEEITIDISYHLNIPFSYWDKKSARNNSFDFVMNELHGYNIYNDPQLHKFIKSRRFHSKLIGSPLPATYWEQHFKTKKPQIILEVGVFHGLTSTAMAKKMKRIPGMEHSIVLSMDTWLNDLRFVRNHDPNSTKFYSSHGLVKLFEKHEIGGSPDLYYQFLKNVLKSGTQDRIIPLQTSSSNGAMALIAHGIRPDFMYIDASHANPDVLIDFINFYELLTPGGTMSIDDRFFPVIASSMKHFESKYKIKFSLIGDRTAYVEKPAT